jgi:hypothetical protein
VFVDAMIRLHRKSGSLVCLLFPLLLAAPMTATHAQDFPARASKDDPFMVVRVSGVRAIPWKSYRAMRAGMAAYEAHKDLAPNSAFRFAVLTTPANQKLPPDFKLRVRTKDDREHPITLKQGELFELPLLPDPDTDADIVSNWKGAALRIGLLVHTLSVLPEQERLGDARLRCEINRAMEGVAATGGRYFDKRRVASCQRTATWHVPRAPATGAWITEGNRREALESDGNPAYPAFRLPLAGEGWGNDAIVSFDYRTPVITLSLSEVAIYNAR